MTTNTEQKLDTIYLFSDGLPNIGQGLPVEAARALEETKRAEILGKYIRTMLKSTWNREAPSRPRVRGIDSAETIIQLLARYRIYFDGRALRIGLHDAGDQSSGIVNQLEIILQRFEITANGCHGSD